MVPPHTVDLKFWGECGTLSCHGAVRRLLDVS